MNQGPSTNRSMLKIYNASCLKIPPKPDLVPKSAIFMNKAGLEYLALRRLQGGNEQVEGLGVG